MLSSVSLPSKEAMKKGLQTGLEKTKVATMDAIKTGTEVAKKAKEIIDSTKQFEYNYVTIVGEAVSFVPTGLSPQETTIVEFDKFYKPDGISDEEYQILVKTMRKLFDGTRKAIADPSTGEDSEKGTFEPLPPCSEKEKYLVLQSLLHRKRVLFQQLYDNGIFTPEEMKKKINELKQSKRGASIEGKESLFVRNLLLHVLRLEKFIEFYVQSQECINVEDIVYGKLQLDLDDDRIKELLRQFIFFILQSNHPLKDYTGIDPAPPVFIGRLEKKLLKQEGLKKYLSSYQENKFAIPPTIAKVLEATELDKEAMKKQLEEAIAFERLKIIKIIEDTIPKTHRFWKTLGDSKDITRMIDTLRLVDDDAVQEINILRKEKDDLDKKLKTCEQARLALEAEKASLSQRLATAEATLATRGDQEAMVQQLRQEKTDMENDFNQRLARLTEQVRECNEQKANAEARIQSLTALNQQLTTEIEPLRIKAGQLDEYQRRAQQEIDELRREHARALEEERQRTQEKETQRASMEAERDQVRATLATCDSELVRAQTELRTAETTIVSKNQSIAELTNALRACEATTTTLRTQITEKTNEIRQLNKEILQRKDSIRELEEQLRKLQEDMNAITGEADKVGAQVEKAQEQMQTLADEIQQQETAIKDLERELKACTEEKERLSTKASGSNSEAAKLTGALTSMKEERDAAIAQQNVLKNTIQTLQNQLKDSEEERKRQVTAMGQKNSQIALLGEEVRQKTDALQEKTDEAEEERQRADTAEAKIVELESEKSGLIANSEKRLQETRDALDGKFQEGLKQQKEQFDKTIADQENKAKDEVEKARGRTEELLGIVKEISEWIDTGATPEAVVEIEDNTPGSKEFRSIMQKILSKPVAIGVSSPKSEKEVSAKYICYLVFLTAIMWQTNMYPVSGSEPTDAIGKELYKRQQCIVSFFPTLLNGGSPPPPPTWAESTGAGSGSVASTSQLFTNRPGLYQYVYEKTAAPATRGAYGGHTLTPPYIIQKYLILLNKIARAMETPTKGGKIAGLLPVDIPFIDSLLGKLDEFIKEYSKSYPSLNLQSSFGQVVGTAMLANMPHMNKDIIDKYLIKNKENDYVVVTKTDASEPSKLNYAVVFYCFLVMMRDNLYHIEQDAKTAQCPLPTFLDKSKK